MDLQTLPIAVRHLLEDIDTEGKQLTWKIHDFGYKIQLSLVWTEVSTFPAHQSKQRKPALMKKAIHPLAAGTKTHPSDTAETCSDNKVRNNKMCAKHSINSTGAQILSQAEKPKALVSHRTKTHQKKKKSPSRLKRDRKRLLEFRKKKATEKPSNKNPNEDLQNGTAVPLQPGNILHSGRDPRTIASDIKPITVAVDEKTRMMDMKRSVTRNMKLYGLPLSNTSSIVLNIVDTLHAGSPPLISNAPDDLLLQDILIKYSHENLRCHVEYDIDYLMS